MSVTQLYRYWDANDVLLYVGISFSSIARAAQHKTNAGWWTQAVRSTIENFPTRGAAEAAEWTAIQTERPKFNKKHNCAQPKKLAPVDAALELYRATERSKQEKATRGYQLLQSLGWITPLMTWETASAFCQRIGIRTRDMLELLDMGAPHRVREADRQIEINSSDVSVWALNLLDDPDPLPLKELM